MTHAPMDDEALHKVWKKPKAELAEWMRIFRTRLNVEIVEIKKALKLSTSQKLYSWEAEPSSNVVGGYGQGKPRWGSFHKWVRTVETISGSKKHE